jgi:uncharacterized protein YecE (DUF72 family)
MGVVMAEQLDMFGAAVRARVGPAEVSPSIRTAAQRLPPRVRLGTSSWSFPGWAGIVYDRRASERVLSRDGLAAYAAHPHLRTVGVDRTYYAPVSADDLRKYADLVPDDFRFLVKAHVDCTIARFSMHPQWGDRAGRINDRCFDPEYASRHVVAPFVEGLGEKGGVLLFQLPPQPLEPLGGRKGFPDRLRVFFSQLPPLRHGVYALEVRSPELVTTRYAETIRELGVEHCVNVLLGLADPETQWRMTGGPDRRTLVVRWMLNRRHDYQSAKQTYTPFDALVDEDLPTRAALARICTETRAPSYVIVNNKAEGSSPLSIERLVAEIVGRG